MTSQTAKQIITILSLLNILTSKSNQTLEFAELTEYNMRNTFLGKIIQKMWWRN